MSQALRIRGQEIKAYLVVDGQTLLGSFTKLESLSIKPMHDLTSSDFLGETESEPDQQHHGYDINFVIHEMDNQALTLFMNTVAELDAGTLLSNINMVVLKTYRDPAVPPETIVLQNLRLKLDSFDFSGRKEYVKNSFSGRCKSLQMIP